MSQLDQIESEYQTEGDFNEDDSNMEDAGVADVAETPQTMSLAPSDSQDASGESTRASTPTENRAEDAAADIRILNPFEKDETPDDVTMKDIGNEKKSPAGAADDFGNLRVLSWPSSTVIDPGSSPWKAGTPKSEPMDYASDPQKAEDLLRANDPDSPLFYKP